MVKSSKKWGILTIAITVVLIGTLGVLMLIVDPWFHFHKPLQIVSYRLGAERYINDGIARNYDYNAIVTGTSMVENTKASEVDELFGANTIKVPFSGGSYKEINQILRTATKSNDNIKLIIRGLDYNMILDGKDAMRYDSYPTYLYDDELFNDVNYIFNKRSLLYLIIDLLNTVRGTESDNFDSYANWNSDYSFGKEAVDATYARGEKEEDIIQITDEDYRNIEENITQNVIALADENPEIEFYLFLTPYSIYYWDSLNQLGTLERQLQAEKYVLELLLGHENIHIYSFFNNYELICDLENYKDIAHYGEEVNSHILKWMRQGNYEITLDNYKQYCEDEYNFYMNYDYGSLFD